MRTLADKLITACQQENACDEKYIYIKFVQKKKKTFFKQTTYVSRDRIFKGPARSTGIIYNALL